MSECPICYQAIKPEEEAYLDLCFHRFCYTVSRRVCNELWLNSLPSHKLRQTATGS